MCHTVYAEQYVASSTSDMKGPRQRNVAGAPGSLFEAQGFDGIETGGFLGRIVAEEDADETGEHDREDDPFDRDLSRPLRERRHYDRSDEPEDDADHPADRRENNRFGKELAKNRRTARSDRHAQADLACPLGNRDHHDIHDADAAHNERDGRYARE